MKHIHDGSFCQWCTDYMTAGTRCDRPEVIDNPIVKETIQQYVNKMRILESTITSMTTTMAMKDVHIRTLEAEVKRLQDIVTSN